MGRLFTESGAKRGYVGLLPYLLNDMENIGLAQTYTDALFGSAEEYIRVGERATRIAAIKNREPLPASGSDLCSESLVIDKPGTQSFGLGIHELSYSATDAQALVSAKHPQRRIDLELLTRVCSLACCPLA